MSIFCPPDPDLLGSPQIPSSSSLSPSQSVAQTSLRLTRSRHLLSRCSQPSCLGSLPRARPPSSQPRRHCHPSALAQDTHPNSGHHFQCWTDLLWPGPAWQPPVPGGARALPRRLQREDGAMPSPSLQKLLLLTQEDADCLLNLSLKPHPRGSAPTVPATPRRLQFTADAGTGLPARGGNAAAWTAPGTKTRQGRGPGLEEQEGGCFPTAPLYSVPGSPSGLAGRLGVGRYRRLSPKQYSSLDNCPLPTPAPGPHPAPVATGSRWHCPPVCWGGRH